MKIRRVVKLSVQCSEIKLNENTYCEPKESYASYACETGFIFEDGTSKFIILKYLSGKIKIYLIKKETFNALCNDKNEWEKLPRCIKSNQYYILSLRK